MSNYFARLLLIAVFLCACEENPPDSIIPQFNRPQDVTMVCWDSENDASLPLQCCANTKTTDGPLVEGYCDSTDKNRLLLALVTQTTFGEVAVINLSTNAIIDNDKQIPYNSFIPVGGQPSDIISSFDGKRVYTANFETGDLSVIKVSKSLGPRMFPATSIGLGGPAARLAIATAPSIRDQFAFVTQPTLGRLAIVALPVDGDNPDAPDDYTQAKLLGYMRLDSSTGIGNAPVDLSTDGIQPWSLVISKNDLTNHSLFVSGKNGHYIAELDTEILVNRALALDSVGEIGEDALVRRIDLYDFTARNIAMEPENERWIHVVENELGGVLVVDLAKGELLPVNLDNPMANDAYSIEVPGIARTVTMVTLKEADDYPGPLTFNGTFGIVSTTQASLFVIDAEDLDALDSDKKYTHTLRSGMDWIDEEKHKELVAEALASGLSPDTLNESDWTNYPKLEDAPILEADDQILEETTAAGIASITAADAGVGECNPTDKSILFGGPESYGFKFRCDKRISSSESWTLTWEGAIGVSGAAVIQWELVDKSDRLPVMDKKKDFCPKGVLGAENGDDFSDIYNGLPGLENYQGDLLEITSSPITTIDGDSETLCADYINSKTIYAISKINADNTLIITALENKEGEKEEDKKFAPLPTFECFGQAFTYKIRAHNHWIMKGSSSRYIKRGERDNVTGQCLPYLLDSTAEEINKLKNFRVFPGINFYNNYFTFKLMDGTLADKSLVDEISFKFATSNGFTPLYSTLGNDVTDIEITPNNELLLIDQAGEGLIRFDLTEKFEPTGTPVN